MPVLCLHECTNVSMRVGEGVVYLNVHAHTHTCVYVYLYVHVFVRVSMCLSVIANMPVCVNGYAYVYACHTFAHACVRAYVCVSIYLSMQASAYPSV